MTRGELRLRAEPRGARTVLTELYRTAPFHPGPLSYRSGRAETILQEVSPGLLPGDELAADVEVADGASLIVSGQGATRVYPSRDGVGASARTTLTAHGSGELWWLPEPIIPFRDARFAARTEVRLGGEARFALLEVVTQGRLAAVGMARPAAADRRGRPSPPGGAGRVRAVPTAARDRRDAG